MGNTANSGLAILNETDFPVTCTCSMGATHHYENHVQPGQIFYRWPGAVWMTLSAFRTTESTLYTPEKCRKELIVTGCLIAGGGLITAGTIAAAIVAGPAVARTTGSVVAKSGVFAGATKKRAFSIAAVIQFLASNYGHKLMPDYNTGACPFDALTNVKSMASYEEALKISNLKVSRAGCYAGGDGTWLILSGGPQFQETSAGEGRWIAQDFTLSQVSRADIWNRGEFTAESYEWYYNTSKNKLPKEVRNNPPRKAD